MLMGASAELSIQVPDELAALPSVRSALRAWLEDVGVEGQAADDIVLASWEACANAVEHPLHPGHHEVLLDARASRSRVCVSVHDSGCWRGPTSRPYRGLGLEIVNALMDDVSIRRARDGTVVRMCREVESGPGPGPGPGP